MVGLLAESDRKLLLSLLSTCTVGPLEAASGAEQTRMWLAQDEYARAAEAIGLRRVRHASPPLAAVTRPDVPLTVRDAARDPSFLSQQPSLVMRLGAALPVERTVMFNVHLDTVSGMEPVSFNGSRFTGRGAIDAKGPAVALLSGIRAALARESAVGRDIAVLVQVVSGEEGGAMGTFGTRPLVESGFVGRLNVFCEPTGLRYLTRSTAAMTACVRVDGEGAIDDRPDTGHNATVLLGFLAQHLAAELDPGSRPGRVCVAGLHTGDMHNRVYGSGRLLLNLSYATSAEGVELEQAVAGALRGGLHAFTRRFAGSREFGRTAADCADITTLEWHKRGLPCLRGTEPWAAELLERSGLRRWPDDEPAFTCDAIWMDGVPGTATAVLGPGSLDRNNAHAEGEFAELAELEEFASAVADVLVDFVKDCKDQPNGNRP
ncbi:M20/M25/M40 family metallo-hydrolase [Saccharopolyspora erythraea]|uniref:M20/M25/M40 family metallo-hydrolase n=1 Tax=Saccharopolyspora erythraea TaxID=1836 RepID=UPI001BACD0DD|nr:M20/M25/M40 family metallo-hydrolase [Saccharopolyspora erythraea]QUH03301.1 M20/M25/M40 family metallo-hydrolase [Saccharopolyspora erythraea]